MDSSVSFTVRGDKGLGSLLGFYDVTTRKDHFLVSPRTLPGTSLEQSSARIQRAGK